MHLFLCHFHVLIHLLLHNLYLTILKIFYRLSYRLSRLLRKFNHVLYPIFLHSFSYIIYLFTDKFSGLKCYNNLCFLWRNYKTVCCFFYRSCSCNLSRLFYISQEICHMLILSGTFQCKCSIFT